MAARRYDKEWHAAWAKRRRARFTAAGLCVICGVRQAAHGRKGCAECLSKACDQVTERFNTIDGRMKSYKLRAKRQGSSFALPQELFADLATDNCFYCGRVAEPLNGIDRVDSARGYEQDNCVTACAMCNRAKNATSREAFEAWVLRAAEHIRAPHTGGRDGCVQ